MTNSKHTLKNISYSALSTHRQCGHFFKKKYLEKVDKTKESTIWTAFGTLVHAYIQAVVNNEMAEEDAAKKFIRSWLTFCKIFRQAVNEQYVKGDKSKDPAKLCFGPVRANMNIKKQLKEKFGEYEVESIEMKLLSETKYPQGFKGFIDLVLKVNNGSKVIIFDFKTTSTHFMFTKFRDKYKDYQLTLYKHFYCEQTNFNPKCVETYFITIPKDYKEKVSIKFTRITSGPKKISNALKWMHGVLNSVKHGIFIKNKFVCDNFYGKDCLLKGTEHCIKR